MVKLKQSGYGLIESVIVLAVFVLVLLIMFLVLSSDSKVKSNNVKSSSHITTAGQASFKILAPATVAPKSAECSQSVTYASSGQPVPIQCANGDLNVTAWNSLATIEPTVMSLGYSPSQTQVQSSLCQDANAANADSSSSASNAIELEVYQISALYYGWHFPSDPSIVLSNGTC